MAVYLISVLVQVPRHYIVAVVSQPDHLSVVTNKSRVIAVAFPVPLINAMDEQRVGKSAPAGTLPGYEGTVVYICDLVE